MKKATKTSSAKKAVKAKDNGVGLIEQLFNAGVHLGHKKNRLNPKAKKYVYKMESGISIIDLTKTAEQLEQAKKAISESAKDGKTLLVVATKRIANQFVNDLCKNKDIFYITTKWLPGLLTNFETIMKNVKRLNDLKVRKEDPSWEKLVKHEKNKLNKEISRLDKLYGGITSMTKKPDVMFIVDTKKEKNAVTEAQKNNIKTIAIVDTNSNPEEIDYPIVGNDDSLASVQYLVNEIIGSYTKK